jgi:hypothetical protein
MVCILTVAISLFGSVAVMTRPQQTRPRAHVSGAFNPHSAGSSSETRPIFTEGDRSLPPVHTLDLGADIGPLGLPKRLKEYFIPTARDDMLHTVTRTAAIGEGSTSSIGHVPGCADSEDVLLLVDSQKHLQAVDEARSSQTCSSAMRTSQGSSTESLLERQS